MSSAPSSPKRPKMPGTPSASSLDIPGTTKQNAIYRIIMTPITLVSFLLSLAIVDFRYTLMRSHTHSDDDPSRMPTWLHNLLYRPRPYQYVKVKGETEGVVTGEDGERFYYHSKQKKLMRMEAEDAFQIRWIVLGVLGVILALVGWGTSKLATWVWRLWKV